MLPKYDPLDYALEAADQAYLNGQKALAILEEFCEDLEAHNMEEIREFWPDLHMTYVRACKLLRRENA